ncbi:hypothetical protein JTE90_028104 [Oedothorax gibbosus]|uniref:pseudouridine 5'-phosphatase n=1 Tax=Oedothorax gibbosus TaxID=931172 RepID=A0AAV6VAI5_9ARAC|nr:hypothetical protein JTE90_028104 [Oedothorax gibbosus]
MAFKPVTHVLFDMDGLLLDTENLYTEIYQTIASKYGKTYTWELKVQLMGMVSTDSVKAFIEKLQIPMTEQEFNDTFRQLCNEYFLRAETLPGVERLIKHLHAHNIPIAIATSSMKSSFDLKTKNHQELVSLFNHVVCGSSDPEVKQGKPAPDVFLVCASRFADKPSPDKVLVFEDAPLGVQAARAAGMQVVMVPDPRMSEELRKEATQVLASLEDFRPELFGLPPFVDI